MCKSLKFDFLSRLEYCCRGSRGSDQGCWLQEPSSHFRHRWTWWSAHIHTLIHHGWRESMDTRSIGKATRRGTNISHQTGKGKSSTQMSLFGMGYVIVPRRVIFIPPHFWYGFCCHDCGLPKLRRKSCENGRQCKMQGLSHEIHVQRIYLLVTSQYESRNFKSLSCWSQGANKRLAAFVLTCSNPWFYLPETFSKQHRASRWSCQCSCYPRCWWPPDPLNKNTNPADIRNS